MRVADIYGFLCEKYPLEAACDFDNPGLLVGNADASVTRALVALDCSKSAFELALSQKCGLIVTHHPVIFQGLKSVTSDTTVYRLIEKGISVISMHTNLDTGAGGVNETLCSALGLKDITPVTAHDGYSLLKGRIEPLTADALASHIGKSLGTAVKYCGEGVIGNVLVCSGSGGNFLCDVRQNGCDALITADVKHNVFIDAGWQGIAVFDAGHFNTEDVVVEPLAEMLRSKFPDTAFITSHETGVKYKINS